MKFSQKEDDFIRSKYLTVPSKRIAKQLGRSEGTARQRMKILGLVVPLEIVQKFREDSYIKKGSVSYNKGKKQIEYMSMEAIENTKATRFQKGQLPSNTKEKDLIVSIRPNRHGINYKFIRISIGKWIPLARYNWKQIHGPIAFNMKISHKDGDPMNCQIENLELITPGELMKRNTLHNYPIDIKKTIQLGGILTRKINSKTKQINEKQNK